ncbi:MAG: hypothetical protein WC618_05005 [Patescibacteria group bacterium]
MEDRTALLSVYYKNGIIEFAKALMALGWQILASGGTAKHLLAAGVPVRDIGEIVGEPILGHRVVTLSREIHAGLLARELAEDEAELMRLGLPRIDLVCVDLYPLKEEIAKQGSTRESVIEKTDVGGPTMLHSGAKGERIVICDPSDRMKVIEWLKAGCPDEQNFIDQLDAKADAIVADYCLTSARYRSGGRFDGMVGELVQTCKYGENAQQAPAALYREIGNNDPLALHNFQPIEGDLPSYNNWCDIDRMLQTMTHLAAGCANHGSGYVPAIAIGVKHGNPCGIALSATSPELAIRKMVSGDTRAIFGGLVMTNFPIDGQLANVLRTTQMPEGQKRLLDGVVAPAFTPEAIEVMARKHGKCRVIVNPALSKLDASSLDIQPRRRPVRGGFLQQPNYTFVINFSDTQIEQVGKISIEQRQDLLVAWAVGSTSNSNTITLVKDLQLIGNGVGQQDRVGCCELAIKRATDAGHLINGAVAYSDSFFPFPDGPEVLAKAGIKAILASSGSVNDAQVKAVCKAHNIALVMVPDKIGRGFFGH